MEKPENQILVIFGASGDLTKRKLLPSLFGLHLRGLLPDKFRILGAARTEMSAEEYRKLRRDDIVRYDKPSEEDAKHLDSFMELVDYIHFNTDDSKQYKTLADKIRQLQDECGIADNVLFYLSMPPGIFDYVTESLKESGLNKSKNGFRRIVIEKPRKREEAQPRARLHLPRTRDLQDRPLPRQGDSPEHSGSALRQRNIRASLEQELY